MKPSFTVLVSGLFLAYISYSLYTIAQMFFPVHCVGGAKKCLTPYIAKDKNLQMSVYTSVKTGNVKPADLSLIWDYKNFTLLTTEQRFVDVEIPRKVRRNGTMYLHVFVYPAKHDPFSSQFASQTSCAITTHMVPQSSTFSLLNNEEKTEENKEDKSPGGVPVTHWRSKVMVNVMEDEIAFERNAIPGDLYRYLQMSPRGDYLPMVYIDQLAFRTRDLMLVNKSVDTLPLAITYTPISVGKLRMWTNMLESIKMLHGLGFTEKDTDEIKGIFSDTNFYFLMMTFAVAAIHLLFDFLAFKNDISFWRDRDTMVGLSTRAVIWRCVSTFIIFLYLYDQETSLLVLVPAGISTIIEMWKVKKAFKVSITWQGIRPVFNFGASSAKEMETAEFDYQAMKYLSYVLYPLCMGGAVYSLLYVQHKSWYSWCINSLVNGVYAFGFLFMLPQLFVNYKLKSVAHLPWRAFMYKAFNTFIDDIFAFIITMPTAHRLACFRDDVVFVVYLYQRWLYPVDKTRVNEYGQTFEEEAKQDKGKPKTD